MCGIVGSFGKLDFVRFKKSLDSIKHRGPDNEGIYLYDVKEKHEIVKSDILMDSRYVALGHRRLSIIDLADVANQPMTLDNYSLIFNGEIYNYKEIRRELIGCGYSFETKSDTEVLLKSYIHWGEDCVDKFNGMWAFCIFDILKQEFFISRDRIGVKPLYYYLDDNNFYFASEIKAILEFKISRVANKKEIVKFLIYGAQENTEATTFNDISRFPAGQNGIFSLNTRKFKLNKYFELDKNNIESSETEEELRESIKLVINDSVNLRLRSDVDIGMALSGGVDSNIVVNLVNQQKTSISTFSSIYTDDDAINETDNIKITVDKLKLNSNFTTVNKSDILNHIENIVWHQDEPFDTLGILAQNKVYELMNSKGVKVSLDGQGADEIYAGYPAYKAIFLRENIGNILMYKQFLKCGFFTFSNLKLLILSFVPKLFEKLYFRKRANELFSKKVRFISSEKKGFVFFKNLNQKLIYDTKEYLPVLLRYVDRNSMQFSIESRGIFLDYKVIENALKIPSKYKIKKCYSKYIVRSSYTDIVPEKIIWDKKKLGFPVPQKAWMEDNEVASIFKSYIKNSKIIKLVGIDKIPQKNTSLYWRLVNIAIWEKVFKVSKIS